jgi:hypothetical protein
VGLAPFILRNWPPRTENSDAVLAELEATQSDRHGAQSGQLAMTKGEYLLVALLAATIAAGFYVVFH